MTKLMPLYTIEHGIRRAFALLGDAGVEQAIEEYLGLKRSASLIRKCGDADDDSHHLQLRYAIALDRACRREVGQSPLLECMAMQVSGAVDAAASSDPPSELTMLKEMLGLQVALGRLARDVTEALKDISPEGCALSEPERHKVFASIDELEIHLEAFKSVLAQPLAS
ncbi:hypothetical protein PGB28_16185 [Primorskyibacter aestuariivivens]|uniref:hypothetical protein n=1 Tax=Primorskyibacter aestuariivivens TaxID=1888912 RepID=UPI0023018E24|nr:hypothetical protein [Primorskyibacter aestuariivivens]MDA7430005.1 hypothetical protein [Primorskyibacter aestuariivivens]